MADNGWGDTLRTLFSFLSVPEPATLASNPDYPTTNKFGRPVPSQLFLKPQDVAPKDFPINTKGLLEGDTGSLANAVSPPIPVEIKDLITKAKPLDSNNVTGAYPPLYDKQGLQNLNQVQADISFNEALRKVENGPMIGRNDDGFWHPHASPEGGRDTIGYGHKLTSNEVKTKKITLSSGKSVDFSDGLSDAEITAILNDDILTNREKASKNWDSYAGEKGSSFKELPREYQNILTNIVFNAGSLVKGGKFQWPKLAEAIKSNDIKGIRKQMITSYTDPSGKVKPLTKRANIIADALGLVPNNG